MTCLAGCGDPILNMYDPDHPTFSSHRHQPPLAVLSNCSSPMQVPDVDSLEEIEQEEWVKGLSLMGSDDQMMSDDFDLHRCDSPFSFEPSRSTLSHPALPAASAAVFLSPAKCELLRPKSHLLPKPRSMSHLPDLITSNNFLKTSDERRKPCSIAVAKNELGPRSAGRLMVLAAPPTRTSTEILSQRPPSVRIKSMFPNEPLLPQHTSIAHPQELWCASSNDQPHKQNMDEFYLGLGINGSNATTPSASSPWSCCYKEGKKTSAKRNLHEMSLPLPLDSDSEPEELNQRLDHSDDKMNHLVVETTGNGDEKMAKSRDFEQYHPTQQQSLQLIKMNLQKPAALPLDIHSQSSDHGASRSEESRGSAAQRHLRRRRETNELKPVSELLQDSEGSDGDGSGSPPRMRRKASEQCRSLLMDWLVAHYDHPYPTKLEKEELAQRTGMSVKQVVHWMSNIRKRRFLPLLSGKKIAKSPVDIKFLEEVNPRMTTRN